MRPRTREVVLAVCSRLCVVMGKKKQKRQHGRGERQSAHLACTRLHGLPNRGNTCYFNAVLQAVCSAPTLTEALAEHSPASSDQQPLAAAFARLAISLDSTGTRPTPPDQLLGAVRNRWPQFKGHEQQDAQELYTMLLTGIEEEEAAAACNPDGTSATQAEKREAARLLSLVGFSLFPAGSRAVESRESEPLLLPYVASNRFLDILPACAHSVHCSARVCRYAGMLTLLVPLRHTRYHAPPPPGRLPFCSRCFRVGCPAASLHTSTVSGICRSRSRAPRASDTQARTSTTVSDLSRHPHSMLRNRLGLIMRTGLCSSVMARGH